MHKMDQLSNWENLVLLQIILEKDCWNGETSVVKLENTEDLDKTWQKWLIQGETS